METCTICRQTLPLDMFCKDHNKKGGYEHHCKKCKSIQRNKRNHNLGIHQPYTESKTCSQYLGVHIAEQLLANVFTNVSRMPFGNKGYDFICGKGFKVDVKSACLHRYLDKSGHKTSTHWEFNIRCNKIPDYFACIALDNRTSLTPIHFWIIPSNIINNKTILEISLGAISKWLQYEQSLDKVLLACDVLKTASAGAT